MDGELKLPPRHRRPLRYPVRDFDLASSAKNP